MQPIRTPKRAARSQTTAGKSARNRRSAEQMLVETTGCHPLIFLAACWSLRPGDTVLYHATAGGVGQIFVQWAKALGLKVIGTVSSDAKAKLARHAGCDHVINYSSEDFVAEALAFTPGNGVAAVFDAKSFGQVSKCVEMSKQRRDCSNAAALASAPGEITGALMDAARDLQPS